MHLLPASLILLAQLAAAADISLSSFTPRIDNLPSACRAVYTTPIDGCAASDFAAAATCSLELKCGDKLECSKVHAADDHKYFRASHNDCKSAAQLSTVFECIVIIRRSGD
ncbi:hypothetical protein E8E12_011584 [Didymella heteroderae]|uniref:Extracellular membrane protein CFEM domain-containing protein n=1 Tax=Didymella heteroderae TaxID=1769908 RepID=A0A9P5C4X1_9PLEO|nr:hypothetical protein E8E12_011584 [Didymella heteroderae]